MVLLNTVHSVVLSNTCRIFREILRPPYPHRPCCRKCDLHCGFWPSLLQWGWFLQPAHQSHLFCDLLPGHYLGQGEHTVIPVLITVKFIYASPGKPKGLMVTEWLLYIHSTERWTSTTGCNFQKVLCRIFAYEAINTHVIDLMSYL